MDFFKVKGSPMSVSQSEGSTHAGLYRWQQTWAAGISYHAGKKGTEPAKSWDAHAWRCCERPSWQVKKSTKKPRRPQTKAGIVQEMDPFQKPSKPSFHRAWQAYSIEPGQEPSRALIYYCQTVCCLYLPRLTNWTLTGLAAPPESRPLSPALQDFL